MNKGPTLEEFSVDYTGDPAFLKEAYMWFLLGRLDGMMQHLKIEEEKRDVRMQNRTE